MFRDTKDRLYTFSSVRCWWNLYIFFPLFVLAWMRDSLAMPESGLLV
jgi:hypothetical protein